MDLFALPTEIRLKIFSELLVHHGPMNFLGTSWANFKSRRFSEEIDLFPALLRVNKQVYSEAIPLLYSYNCFRFSDPDATLLQCHTTFSNFVQQIGAQANLLRHVCIDFPTAPLEADYICFGWTRKRSSDLLVESSLEDVHFDNLDLLRKACPGIRTLELSLPSERTSFVLRDSHVFSKFLDLIHARIDTFTSLRTVKVDVKLLDRDTSEKSSDGTDDSEDEDDCWETHKDSLTQLCSHGWTVIITKIPIVKKTWISDNEGDEYDYDNFGWHSDESQPDREIDDEFYR